jgi:hypothetical protein
MENAMKPHRAGVAIALLFTPALCGIALGSLNPAHLSTTLVRFALVLLGIDQARMAWVDLMYSQQAQHTTADPRLSRFDTVTISTILWELIGFYGAIRWPVVGMIVVFSSQLWFHCLAPVQWVRQPDGTVQAGDYTIAQRGPVLIADGVLIGLLGCILGAIAPLGNAIAVLVLILAYLAQKILATFRS